MRGPERGTVAFAAVLCAWLLLLSPHATARVAGESEYTQAQTYSAALRYLRVDLGYEVTERDPEAAYLIFRYQLPGQSKATATGSVEIVTADGHVKLFVQIASMPEYHERVLRDGLVRKLHEEYGAPRRKPPAEPPKTPTGDGGTD